MERDSFIVYKSFYGLIKLLKPAQRLEMFESIFEYGFSGATPTFADDTSMAIWQAILPQLKANQRRYENGVKGGEFGGLGGRPKKPLTGNEENPDGDMGKTPKITPKGDMKITPNKTPKGGKIKTPNENENENENVNVKEEEKEEESKIPFYDDFIKTFGITADNYSANLGDMDFKSLIDAYNESSWLRLNILTLSQVCRDYKSIIGRKYKDYEVPNKSKADHFDNERRLTEEEMNVFDDVDKIEF